MSKIETGERRIDVLEFKALLKTFRVDENKKLKKIVEQFFELEKQ